MNNTNGAVASRLVKVREVADRLAVGRTTVYGLMESGDLPYVKIGKCRRVPLDAVEALVARGLVAAGA